MTPIDGTEFAQEGYEPEAEDPGPDVTESLGQELNARMQEARGQAEAHARNAAIATAESNRWWSVMRACEAGLKSLVADANRAEPSAGGRP
jgi:hypothetical protein